MSRGVAASLETLKTVQRDTGVATAGLHHLGKLKFAAWDQHPVRSKSSGKQGFKWYVFVTRYLRLQQIQKRSVKKQAKTLFIFCSLGPERNTFVAGWRQIVLFVSCILSSAQIVGIDCCLCSRCVYLDSECCCLPKYRMQSNEKDTHTHTPTQTYTKHTHTHTHTHTRHTHKDCSKSTWRFLDDTSKQLIIQHCLRSCQLAANSESPPKGGGSRSPPNSFYDLAFSSRRRDVVVYFERR